MNNNQILELKKNRLNTLKSNGKNLESNGVIRKLEREVNNMRIPFTNSVENHDRRLDIIKTI